MSFLFKSKKSGGGLSGSRNIASADGTSKTSVNSFTNGDGSRQLQSAMNGSNSSLVAPGADPKSNIRQRSGSDLGSQSAANFASPPIRAPPDLSLYPWSQRRIDFVTQANPFPRYGAAVNASASKDGEVYMMGGLINGSTVKGDLWIVEAGAPNLPCYHVATTSEGPGPRVGHASLLVGNAFIVFGGDTKVDEGDILDDTLYLLNTATKQWSRALPTGARPSGRYGHTLNMLGTRIFIFGGQVEGYFFNDLIAFDLNKLQDSNNQWEVLIQNSNDGPIQGPCPPARTNHTVITWNEKLYLFGGTNGVQWFNDVWAYDPRTNTWSNQDCIGFIPAAREGHAAALVGDVMYIFGGRTKDGNDLGDLTAFRLSTKRWYTFHNMGPSPSPRSGHSMTAIGKQILVLAGEPSSAPPDANELSLGYVLDTDKIRYPNDQPPQQFRDGRRSAGGRRSSADRSDGSRERSNSREGTYAGPDGRSLVSPSPDNANSNQIVSQRALEAGMPNGYPLTGSSNSRLPRNTAAPAGPPPQQQPPPPQQQPSPPQQQQSSPQQQYAPPQSDAVTPRTNGMRGPFSTPEGRESPRPNKLDRTIGPEQSTGTSPSTLVAGGAAVAGAAAAAGAAYMYGKDNQAPSTERTGSLTRDISNNIPQQGSPMGSLRGQEQYAPSTQTGSSIQTADEFPTRNLSRSSRQQSSIGSSYGDTTEVIQGAGDQTKSVQPAAKAMPGAFPVDSGIGSSPALTQQNDELLKELESARNKNAWYASELALARKAGYQPNTPDSPILDDRATDSVGDEEKPLLEALLGMRTEIANLQGSLESQANAAAEKIAQVEQQRDAAVTEAIYAKTRLAAHGGSRNGTPQLDDTRGLGAELEAERKGRQLAEENAEAAHSRALELDAHKQQSTSELERLRAELHEAEQTARDHAANSHEATSSSRMLEIDKNELTSKLSKAQNDVQNHTSMLGNLQAAMTASSDKATLLERKLEEERQQRSTVEEKLAKLRAEHEARTTELDTAQSRLRDAEELAESHASEARSHRDVVLAGFGNPTAAPDLYPANDERIAALQQRLDAANGMVRSNQEAADRATERLRRAEERIAGLESYQEQISREGLNMRKQLQVASRDTISLRAEVASLQQQLSSSKMDSTAISVQHGALKNLLNDRGINTNDLQSSSRSLDDTGAASSQRLQELEAQLAVSNKAHDEMRATFEQREQEANKGWEAKLTALDTDYQAAVKYLKGTEKMLGKMKQELLRQKTTNKELEDELAAKSDPNNPASRSADWEAERTDLHSRLQSSQAQVDQHATLVRSAQAERDAAQASTASFQAQLTALTQQSQSDMEALRTQNRTLEAKVAEAEGRVKLLLDDVGKSVQSYRRHSRNLSAASGATSNSTALAAATTAAGHTRGLSSVSSMSDTLYAGGTDGAGDDDDDADLGGRNSMALDSLASELETLRTHWESSKSWRESGGSDVLASSSTAANGASSTLPGGMI